MFTLMLNALLYHLLYLFLVNVINAMCKMLAMSLVSRVRDARIPVESICYRALCVFLVFI